MVDANHGGNVVTHRAHGVVTFVTMYSPVARFVSDKFNLTHLAHRDIGGHFRPAGCHWDRPPVCPRDFKLYPVHMERVVCHGQVANPDAHAVAKFCHHWRQAWVHSAVESPDIEVEHGVDFGRFAARLNIKGIEQNAIVAIDFINERMWRFGVRDPKAHHPHGHLCHLIGMGVIHKCPRPFGDKFIHKGFAHWNRGLIQTTNAIHAIRKPLTVPVNRGFFG